MKTITHCAALAVFVLVAGCGGGSDTDSSQPPATPELSPEQIENGIGPITSVELTAEINADLALQGEQLFTIKCSACHKTDQRYIGPELGSVTTRRTPEFVMNMILNPEEMVQKHPVARQLLAEYISPMANQNLTEVEARAVLEYLRSVVPTP